MNKIAISKVQAFMLGISEITVTGHLLIIPVIINNAGRDSWLSVIAAILPAVLIGYVTASLAKLYPGKTIVEYCQLILGKWLGKMLAVLFLFYFFHHAALSIRGFGEFFTSAITPRTPIMVYFAAVVILAVYAVRSGLEVLARTNSIFLMTMIPIGLLASALTLKGKEYGNLLPVLEFGPGPALSGAFNLVSLFSAFFVLGMIFPNVSDQKKLRRSSIMTMGILILMFAGPVTGPIALFGAERAMGMSFPTFQMLRDMEIGELQRLDLLGIFLWSLGSFSKISLFLYAVTYGMAQLLNLDDHKFLAAPTGALLVIVSLLLSDNFVDIYRFLQNTYPFYSTFFGLGLPAVLLVVAHIRLRKGKRGGMTSDNNTYNQKSL